MPGGWLPDCQLSTTIVKSPVSSDHSQGVPGEEEAALPVCGRHHPGQGKGK